MEATNYYGQIELNALGDIVRQHPNLVKVATGKDGKTRKYINVYFNARQQTSDHGHTHYMKVAVKKDEAKEGLRYYIGDFKPNEPSEREASTEDVKDLPF